MRYLLLFPFICPSLFWGTDSVWVAKTEEEALFVRRIADFWQEGEYQIAKNQMEEFLIAFPSSSFSDALCGALGDLFLREKNYSTALDYYVKVTNPELVSQIFLNRMQCLYYMEWYATLADECETFLQKEDLESALKLQTTYYLAIGLYQQCLNASKTPETLVKLAERAQPYFEALLESELNHEVAAAFAHLSCILKDYPRASSIYVDLAQKDPEKEEEMLFQAGLIQAEYDKELAAKTFEEIAQKGKNKSKEAAYNRLVLYFDAKQYEKIVEHKEELFNQIPPEKTAMAHLFLGRALLTMKKYAEANEEFKSFLLDAPTDDLCRKALISLIEASYRSDDLASLDFALSKMSISLPGDNEISKGHFSRALMLKKKQQIDDARQEIEALLVTYPECAEAPQAAFELAHLDHQAKAWSSCREKSRAFLLQFPNHDLSPYAWRYLISSSAELSQGQPQSKELKEQLAADLETLLHEKKLLTPQEKCDWQFLLAKTNFELKCYEEAMVLLQSIAASNTPFSQEANGYLIMALCYRDGLGDITHFCSFAEKAIEKETDLIDRGALHASLFNAYLDLSKTDEKRLWDAANHLFAAFESKAHLQMENLFWLGDYLYSHFRLEEEEGRSHSLTAVQKMVSLFEHLLQLQKPEDALLFENGICKLGKLYQFLDRKEEAVALLEKLRAQYSASPSEPWKYETEATFLLGECYSGTGKEEEAISLFDSLAKEKSKLRTSFGASASLQSARLRLAQCAKQKLSPHDVQYQQILAQFKDLVLQKILANEPLHLEAALDYIDLQAQLDGNPKDKRLSLLIKMKQDFESSTDLLSKDYHEARAHFPRKAQIYHAYMRYVETEILSLQALVNDEPSLQKELQKIIDEMAHPALVARVRKRLENAPISEQKA